ncbi:hypothetical protein PMZ80_007215 [Knufia obscura]|uniref:BTB domain-containing protein n=1 Tax=Knufia obscura TaxID=1635080 RepID=A0ABR0RJK3_9EURO|nr:hypothetical protein PMZ80_007215 [Knufia obscura]
MASSSSAEAALESGPVVKKAEVSATQFLKSPIVTVVVGQGDKVQSFPIYKDLLTAHSRFFRGCLNSGNNWKEAQTNVVNLKEEESCNAFEVIASWLLREPEPFKDIDCKTYTLGSLVDAYRLANYLGMEQLKNDLVDYQRARLRAEKQSPALSMLHFLESHGLSQDPFYDFALKTYVRNYLSDKSGRCMDFCEEALRNGQVMRDVLTKIHEYTCKKWLDPCKETGCVYHDHSGGSPCSAIRGVKRRRK